MSNSAARLLVETIDAFAMQRPWAFAGAAFALWAVQFPPFGPLAQGVASRQGAVNLRLGYEWVTGEGAALIARLYVPPGWAFGVIWTALYAMLALSMVLATSDGLSAGAPLALLVYCDVVLNKCWTPLFFGIKRSRPRAAMAVIVVLDVVNAAVTLGLAARGSRRAALAALLWVPYSLWVVYATALNWALWHAMSSEVLRAWPSASRGRLLPS